MGDWKLVYFHEDQNLELFNIIEDIGETENKILDNPSTARDLAELLSEHLVNVNAQMPSYKNTGEEVPYPIALLSN